MDITMFLAQAFGLYLVIAGLALLLNPKHISSVFKAFASSHAAVAMGGFLTLVIGIPLVLIHNIWDGDTVTTIVTVLVWATFLKGLVRVLAPGMVLGWSQSLVHKTTAMQVGFVLMALLGAYLCYVGFGLGM